VEVAKELFIIVPEHTPIDSPAQCFAKLLNEKAVLRRSRRP
jgi:hypothetical protein